MSHQSEKKWTLRDAVTSPRVKYFLFVSHPVLAVMLIGAIVGVWMVFEQFKTPEFLVSAVAAAVGLSYFLLKQQLEEAKLFQELFTVFNNRYDAKNEELCSLITSERKGDLSPKERELLCHYFNLCAEEYLYYAQGYIHPKVWIAWLNGMKVYFADERIGAFWREEAKTGSYYGLDTYLAKKRIEIGEQTLTPNLKKAA